MATRTLQIVLAGDSSSARREFGRVEQASKRMGDRVDRDGRRVGTFASVTSKGFSRVGVAAAGMGAAGAGAAALLAKSFVTGATSINESLTKNQVLFGESAKTIDAWSKTTAGSMGISRQAALEATGTFGNLFVALDIGQKQSAKMSVGLTKLAGDLASFNNASPEEALEAIRSGLVGETEPLRKFGVNLNDATLRAQALKMGLISTVKDALTPQQKALAVNKLLFEQTSKAQGDFARTSGGLANQSRILRARLADTASEIGARLMPFALKGAQALNSLISETQAGRGPLAAMARVIRSVANATSDTVGWFRRHRTTTTALMAVVAAATAAFVTYRVAVLAAAAATRVAAVATRVMTAAQVALNLALRMNPIGLVITALVGLGAALVVAYKRSATFRRVVDAAFDGVKSAAQTTASVIKRIVIPVFNTMKSAAEKVARAVGWVGRAFGNVKGTVGKAADWVNPFGDGPGVMGAIPQFGGSGALMGARPEMAPIAGMASRFGLRVSSGLRPGAVTSSGNPSWHASGEALDVSGSPAGMMGFARFMSQKAGSLAELIYTPLGAWSNGNRYTPTGGLAADHYDHVHVAMDVGRRGQGDGIGQAVQAARSVGLRGSQLETMVAIAGAESGYRASANAAGAEDSRGFWQINVGPGANTDMLKLGNLYNPMINAKAMKAILSRQGLGAWTVYRTGAYRAYLDDARRAIAASSSSGGRAVLPGKSGKAGGGPSPSGTGYIPFGSPWRQFAQNRAIMGGDLGYEGNLARVGVAKAKAEAKNNLPSLIKALTDERAIKKKRLRVITKALRTRMGRARRTRLLQEQAQLIEEIGTLNETLREYKADAKGGATTITQAEALEAGVDTSAGADVGGGGGDTGDSGVAAAIDALRAEMERTRMANERLVKTQGPALVGAVLAAVNGGIGGRVGLGFQTPGYAGQTARY